MEPPRKYSRKKNLRRSGTSLRSSSSSETSSQSHSKSLVSSSDASSHSRSRSPSSRSRSRFSVSKSASKSSFSKSLSSRSKLKSESKSESSFLRSPSLSVSLEQRQPSFLEKVNIPTNASSEDNLDYLPSPESKHNLEKSEPVAAPLLLKDQNEFGRFKVAGETDGNHPGSDGDGAGYSAHKDEDKRHNSRTDVSNDIDVTSEYQRENSDLNGIMTVKPKMLVPVRCGGSYSSGMSTQDILAALRHYGLPAPEENKSNIPVERYFGAARLWPWEIIYYRRLKKGPISQENYARRQEQNREFGIVDRYIRSSSGWGEYDQIGS